MTLVAGLSLGGLPAFIGDLLISWRLSVAADLPTMPEVVVHPGEGGYYAASLAQKLVVVRSYFLLAWAGSRANANRILQELDGLLPENVDTIEDWSPVFDILNSCDEDGEMVALLINQGKLQPLGIRTCGFEIEGKRIYLMGSGSPSFFEYLTEHPHLIPEDEKGDGLMARAVALRFGARAFARQWLSGGGLEESWGGGFEVAYPEPDGFRKIDRVLFRAWRINDAGEYHNSGRSFFVRYYGKDLYLSCFNPGERTYVVSSPVGVPIAPPPFERIHAIWTLDMFLHEPTFGFIEFARYQPEHRPNKDIVEFSNGRITGWSMDRDYVEQCLKMSKEQVKKGDIFRIKRY